MSSIITKIDPPIDTFFARHNPTDADLCDPEFQRVWQAIKGWDIKRNAHEGYAYADGSDVMTILNAIRSVPCPSK